jgi:hypothetical protein
MVSVHNALEIEYADGKDILFGRSTSKSLGEEKLLLLPPAV